MSIKIDGNRPAADVDATRRAGTARTADQKAAADRGEAAKTDRVEVSRDAQLVTSAMKAANDTPAVRQDVVERMRTLLASGDLGQDSGAVADKLIDHLLNR